MPSDAQFDIRSLDQLVALLDGGNFLNEVMTAVADLQKTLIDYRDDHGGKPKGDVTLKLRFQLNKSGDVTIGGEYEVKRPKAPPAAGVAYVDEDGKLSLHSPMLTRMTIRDVTPPEREIRPAAE
ncbi:hypothetical protein [Seohaeicola zhoushanensis]|uniref:Uncharacterized protein n=1 Tax=Seohaeicola zhoushanensis TaxID=1569283 RepID=A0A8J3H162_9RHOB|nr:hypothetical protein [Seohaeicola zhoushanensis]GHF70984.1 hypothetical protein GCM10017056_47370 [Seohaeicola zhoushanensis]